MQIVYAIYIAEVLQEHVQWVCFKNKHMICSYGCVKIIIKVVVQGQRSLLESCLVLLLQPKGGNKENMLDLSPLD